MTLYQSAVDIPDYFPMALAPSFLWLRDTEGAIGMWYEVDKDIPSCRFTPDEIAVFEHIAEHATKAEILRDMHITVAALDDILRKLELWAPGALKWQDADHSLAKQMHDRTIAAARLRDVWQAMSATAEQNDVFHSEVLSEPDQQFDTIETTVSHAFREPHEALQGRTYGEAFCDWLVEENKIPRGARILEVGCGLGIFANALLDRLLEKRPDLYQTIHYTMFDASPELQATQKVKSCAHAPLLTFALGNIETHDFEGQKFDLVLSNEVIADLSVATVSLNNIDRQTPQTPAEKAVIRYGLDCPPTHHGAEPKSVINIGAIQFLETLKGCLAPDGHAVLTEYGTHKQSPKAVRFANHLEFTIHFGHLRKTCETLGFKTDLCRVGDILDFDPTCETIEFASFNTLARRLLPSLGQDLPTLAHTQSSLQDRLGDVMPQIGNLTFLRLDDPRAFSPFRFECLSLSGPDALA